MCGSFPLLSAPHSFFSIWTNLKRSEKIPGAQARWWGESIWLTGPSGLQRNSGVIYQFHQGFYQIIDPEIPNNLCPNLLYISSNFLLLLCEFWDIYDLFRHQCAIFKRLFLLFFFFCFSCWCSSILSNGVTSAGITLTRINIWRWHVAAETCDKNHKTHAIKEENWTRYIKDYK